MRHSETRGVSDARKALRVVKSQPHVVDIDSGRVLELARLRWREQPPFFRPADIRRPAVAREHVRVQWSSAPVAAEIQETEVVSSLAVAKPVKPVVIEAWGRRVPSGRSAVQVEVFEVASALVVQGRQKLSDPHGGARAITRDHWRHAVPQITLDILNKYFSVGGPAPRRTPRCGGILDQDGLVGEDSGRDVGRACGDANGRRVARNHTVLAFKGQGRGTGPGVFGREV